MATVRTYEGSPENSATSLDKLVPNNNGFYGGEYAETWFREEGGGYPEWRAEAVERAAARFTAEASQIGIDATAATVEVVPIAA